MGPYIFSKVMRPLVKYWRSKAIRIVVYLDDGISAATNFSKCQGNSLLVRSDLFKSGFVANKGKCQWVPVEVICWLGIFWDFKNSGMFTPPEKILGILEEVVEIMSCCSISARNLARVTGRIISNFLIMGDVCKLMTKSLHRLLNAEGVGMRSLFWTLTSCWNLNFGASIYGVLIVDLYGGRLFCLLALSILTLVLLGVLPLSP